MQTGLWCQLYIFSEDSLVPWSVQQLVQAGMDMITLRMEPNVAQEAYLNWHWYSDPSLGRTVHECDVLHSVAD